MGRILIILGLLFFLLTLVGNFFDIKIHLDGSKGVTPIGNLWYTLSPDSLQMFEVIVSRYIDPCATLDILNCSGFLWHPVISSFLTLPAGPVLAVISFLLIYFGLSKRKTIIKKS
tara:strand:+ start:112 stop:456 length:345 start_codon:yes stop_codon:yes gene_type:complete